MCAINRCILAVLLGLAIFASGCGQEKKQEPVQPRPGEMTIIPKDEPKEEIDPLKTLAVLETDKGTIEIEFVASAPKTSRHIIDLIQKRFYNLGMRFFRVDETVIQTGDPTNTGYEGSSQTIDLELWEGQTFRVGSVGMARSDEDLNSARSQFFICKLDNTSLDKDYTLFGQVVSGLDVVQKIEKDDRLIGITLKPKEMGADQ